MNHHRVGDAGAMPEAPAAACPSPAVPTAAPSPVMAAVPRPMAPLNDTNRALTRREKVLARIALSEQMRVERLAAIAAE